MKVKALLISLICCMALCSCGAKDEENGTKLKATEVQIEELVFGIDSSMDLVREELGELVEYSESKSCLYDGYDKTYTFEDVIIITYPMSGGEFISSITVLNSDVKLGCGVKVGDAKEMLESIWEKEDFVINPSCYMLEKEKYGIACYLDGDVITEIEVYLITE